MKKKVKNETMFILAMVEILLPLFAIGLLFKLYSVDLGAGYVLGYVVGISILTLMTKQAVRYHKQNITYKNIYPAEIETIVMHLNKINHKNEKLMESKGTPHHLHDEILYSTTQIKTILSELEETK